MLAGGGASDDPEGEKVYGEVIQAANILENFLLTRHLREYLTLMLAMLHQSAERIRLG